MNQIEQGRQRREQIMDFLRSYIKRNGFSPSFEEVGDAVGVHKNAAAHHLHKLEKEGRIRINAGKYRSLQIIEGDTDVHEVSNGAS